MADELLHGATVLGVWAHPDDEAYLSTGLMLRAVRSGGRAFSLHASLGEMGTADPQTWPPERLGPQRRAELARAMELVGVQEHRVLGFPDGGCGDLDDADVVPVIAEEIERRSPDVVVTFGPDGMTGHDDHCAVSRWVTRAWRQVGMGHLLYAGMVRSHTEKHADLMTRVGLAPDELPGRIEDGRASLVVALDPAELEMKRAVLAAHATQTEPLVEVTGEAAYRAWVSAEMFRTPDAEDHVA
ncbi:MAG: PIG-L family deacetylase [Ornithinimicrobium sp.]